MGRNVFQSSNPVNMIKAVRAVVHENATPDEAMQVFEGEGGTVQKSSTTNDNQQLSDRKV